LNRPILRAALAFLLCAAPALAAEPAWRHGLAMLGEPKYPAGFPHFDYVNPGAPKGGLVRFGAQGTFDNFNLFVAGIKGELENGTALVYDTLMEPAGTRSRPSTAFSPRRCAIRTTSPPSPTACAPRRAGTTAGR
jgi:ABC-type oligopeptide transport system substrate-binding subunit